MLISGKVYFSGGTSVSNAPFEVIDENQRMVLSAKTNENGEFSFEITKGLYEIKANSLDGHIAKWKIGTTQLSPQLLLPKIEISSSTAKPIVQNRVLKLSVDTMTNQELERVVSITVTQQIQPLIEQIVTLQEKIRFSDILGAIGYVFGVFGLLVWQRERQNNKY
jgi:nickel transport protein